MLLAVAFAPPVLAKAIAGGTERVVVLKVDGLSHAMIERLVLERDPRTGKSRLPWIEHVFYEGGTRVENFYVRGMSLSGPSWSLLDTGRHLQIKGNVEFDRYTLHAYDYLNFFPFWIAAARNQRVDMPGTELLDELGFPILADAFPYDERYHSFQLFQRGTRWTTLQRGLVNRFATRTPKELFSEWHVGFETRAVLMEQTERELIEKLSDPKIRYLDYYTTDFDHATHHNNDRATHLQTLRDFDALVGRVWTAIGKTPRAPRTTLIVVSDHGTNTDERVYSQGFSLVRLLGSAKGGGHHVVTKRRVLSDYAIKGVYPLIPLIHSTTSDSYYLKGQSTEYPTALLDFDGNERASIHLRDSDLNLLHLLLQQLKRKDLPTDLRRASTEGFFSTLDRRRAGWQTVLEQLSEELEALRRQIERQRAFVASLPVKFTKEDKDAGRDREVRRHSARLRTWEAEERRYSSFARTLSNLLSLRRESFSPDSLRYEDLFAPGSMGAPNTVHQLQNYVVGVAPGGLRLSHDGSLDFGASFARVNYFSLLGDARVRNNVQPLVGSRPVDFVAVRLPPEPVNETLGEKDRAHEVIWLYGGRDRQALILSRKAVHGRVSLRYLPVANLEQSEDGAISFDRLSWLEGLPLKLWEDEALSIPRGSSRSEWLEGWHTDVEWLRAAHRTHYSIAVVGLHEQLARHPAEAFDTDAPGISPTERLVRRFRERQRRIAEADLLVLANDHWNFDVRGFNPGGNHGSFFRVSTHSTLMFAGGEETGVPRGLAVEEPYDSLSFVPTVFALTGRIQVRPGPVLVNFDRRPRPFPGRVINELFDTTPDEAAPVASNGTAEGQR